MNHNTETQVEIAQKNELFEHFRWGDLEDAFDAADFAREDLGKTVEGCKAIMLWMFDGGGLAKTGEARRSEGVKVRAYALAWLLFPEIFREGSMEELATAIGKQQPAIARAIAELREAHPFMTTRVKAGK